MYIKFTANDISYNGAIDGEIVQVVFDEGKNPYNV